MISFKCNECKQPIDPDVDSYFDLPQVTIKIGQSCGRIRDLHFCSKAHLISWMQKHGEPPILVSAQGNNSLQGPLG